MSNHKPKLISFNDRAYDKARIKFEAYQLKYNETQKKLESILELDLKEVDLSKEAAFKTITKMYGNNSPEAKALKISNLKLMQLRDIPIKELMTSLDSLRVKKVLKPSKEDFKIYTSNSSEDDKLQTAKDFISLVDKLGTKVKFDSPISAPIIRNEGHMQPNHYWIKSIRV